MSDLFGDIEESLSPREAWVRQNKVATFDRWTDPDQAPSERPEFRWSAHAPVSSGVVFAQTRGDALAKLAQQLWKNQGIKPWSLT